MPRHRVDLTNDAESDGELTLRAARGDSGAFEELYRRHSDAAWRVAYAVTGSPHDASDAVSEAFTRVFAALPAGRFPSEAPFRPYVLTATRNAAIDGIRRTGKLQPSEMEKLEFETSAQSPGDAVIGALDSSLVATAFLSLPERWRSVLWLTEVEGLEPREIADMLGVSANGAAQLAVRARAGLREQFLQAHLRTAVKRDCRFTVDHLGAYVGGALSARDIAKVDQHLTGCDECRARQKELADIGSTLRRIVLPIPLGLAVVTAARWKLLGASAGHAARRNLWAGGEMPRAVARPLAVASGLMLALGIIGAAVVNPPSDTQLSTPSRRGPQEASGKTPVVTGFNVAPPIAASAIETIDDLAGQQAARTVALGAPPTASSPPPTTSQPGGGSGSASPPPPEAEPVLQLSAITTPSPTGLAVGDGCTGLMIGGATVLGCPPPAPAPTASLLTIETHGGLLGDNVVAL